MAHSGLSISSSSEEGAWVIVRVSISSSSEEGAWLIVRGSISSLSEEGAWLIVGYPTHHHLQRRVHGS